MKKKVAFYTLGCKVNQYETNAMEKLFSDAGVPMEQKRSLPVVRNSSGTILWIPFVKNSAFAPVTPETEQVLKLLAVHSPE